MTPIRGLRFGHVAFHVRDLDACMQWYAAAFGARELFRAFNEDGSVLLVYAEFAPGQLIEFYPDGVNKVDQPAQPIGYAHTCLVVDDMRATLEHLATLGVTPTAPPRTGRAGQILAFIFDPEGNQIELQEIPAGSVLDRLKSAL